MVFISLTSWPSAFLGLPRGFDMALIGAFLPGAPVDRLVVFVEFIESDIPLYSTVYALKRCMRTGHPGRAYRDLTRVRTASRAPELHLHPGSAWIIDGVSMCTACHRSDIDLTSSDIALTSSCIV